MDSVASLVQEVHQLFTDRGWSLSVAESCTGGLVASSVVRQSGASQFFLGGVVSYANSAKKGLLNVRSSSLKAHSAVSLPVVLEMARGVKKQFSSSWSLSTSGFAGPDSGSEEAPKGTLCIAAVGPGVEWKGRQLLSTKTREEFLELATKESLKQLLKLARS